MDLIEAIRGRRSIRRFTEDRVAFDQLVELVRAGIWAPTAGNAQSWRFVIVDSDAKLRHLKAASPGMLATPAAIIAVCQDKDIAFKKGSLLGRDVGSVMDAAMAAQNIMLAAHAMGLGTCAILSFHQGTVCRFLELPKNVRPELLIAVGVPAINPVLPARVEAGVVFRNTLRFDLDVQTGDVAAAHDSLLGTIEGARYG